ncbi:cbl-associated protein isoform X13 [Haematobia irritans]|uniref:cbl-associated protein isoform X13 n=1 Tax=Haematobia irritans TaxID=7368 RepID=UPI003F4F8530
MPNYRQKNRNRNKNKNRNKQQQQQPQQQQQQPSSLQSGLRPGTDTGFSTLSKDCKPPFGVCLFPEKLENTNSKGLQQQQQQQQQKSQAQQKQEISEEGKSATTTTEPITTSVVESPTSSPCLSPPTQSPPPPETTPSTPHQENVIQSKEIEISEDASSVAALNEEGHRNNVITQCGTVSTEPLTKCNQSPSPKCNAESDQNMGNEKSKLSKSQDTLEGTNVDPNPTLVHVPLTPNSSHRLQAKVIVHRIVCEDSLPETQTNIPKAETENANSVKVNSASVSRETEKAPNVDSATVDIQNVLRESEKKDSANENLKKPATVIVHKIHLENSDSENDSNNNTTPTALSPVHIEEIGGDESLTDVEELRSPIVSEVDSATEGDEGDFEQSSDTDVQSMTFSQREKRKQKRIALENHFLPQILNPRFLDSIIEENSDLSECGDTPLSRSASGESASNSVDQKTQKLNAKYPKSSLDFSKTHKHTLSLSTHHQANSEAIREEPLAFAVEARLQETPSADESCTTLKSFLSPEAELAEMVFINSASSSMSDLNDVDLMERISLHSTPSVAFDLDTDAKDLINKPPDGSENTLTSSSSPSSSSSLSTRASSAVSEFLPMNTNKGGNFVNNNSQMPLSSSSSSPAIHQLDQLTTDDGKQEQIPQSSAAMLFSYGSGGQQRFVNDDDSAAAALAAAERLLLDTQARLLETSCDSVNTSIVSSLRAAKNAKPSPEAPTENVQKNMNTVRDLINADSTQKPNANDLKTKVTTSTTDNRTAQQQEGEREREQNASPTDPKKLRLLCAETLAALPYGGEVLEELATVAQNIGEVRAVNVVKTQTTTTTSSTSTLKHDNNMPYPLPELPHIDDLRLALNKGLDEPSTQRTSSPSTHPEAWLGVPTSSDPKVLVCLSPSQRSYMEQQQQQTVIKKTLIKESHKPDDLLDAHQKFVERRGYHELSKQQLAALEQEKAAEQQLLQTAAMMKKLRKSLTPPPPQIPPPPVPAKSSETATIAQNLSKRSIAAPQPVSSSIATTTTKIATSHIAKSSNDVTAANEADKTANACHDGEENKHRLLSIIQDTSNSQSIHSQQEQQKPREMAIAEKATSSYENNSRQTCIPQQQEHQQQPPATPQPSKPSTFIVPITLTNGSSSTPYKNFPQSSAGNMQSVESSLGEMFPTLGSSNIFDKEQKRFSNIESSSASSEQLQQALMDVKPKRYSSIETHSYESQKRIENGQVVHDYSNSKHDKQQFGDAPAKPNDGEMKFPSRTTFTTGSPSFGGGNIQHPVSEQSSLQSILATVDSEKSKTDDHEIMSALKLNNHSLSAPLNNNSKMASTITATGNSTTTTSSSISTTKFNENSQNNLRDEVDFVKQNQNEQQRHENASERMTALRSSGIEDTYEEFRQRAKEAAAATTNATTKAHIFPTEQVTSNGDSNKSTGNGVISTSSSSANNSKTIFQHDHEKLFKEFDDLSKQLHKELETSKLQREQKERSASLFDLNRVQLRQKEQIEEFNKMRKDHMSELEQEIERSMKSRQQRMSSMERSLSSGNAPYGRTYQIPIQIENGGNGHQAFSSNGEEAPPVPEPPRTYQIPIQIDNTTTNNSADSRFRRSESMFNLSDEGRRMRTYSGNPQTGEDDWSKYASDLGSSENIARPFAKEVEICYQRRPGGIRAPRLTASTNDLSYNSHSYDQFNAYNVRRSQAPMLNRAPQQTRPHYGSCYSMIERDPNPKYISTTSRRGVSPAPQPSGFHPIEAHVSDEQMRQRRASLPREIHEQQLKYIASKEEELRTEFERLQKERQRLLEEVNKAPVMPMPQPSSRPLREAYRSVPKLPTLTEDEVFRQQMAEEWLHKVAEREKRRLQNIIKISKVHEEESAEHRAMQKNMGDEFLNRVKERREKLSMPADSDWESGAESHPANQAHFSESEEVPPVKILEGEHEANLRSLPRHLREFAKFSNHQRDDIEGGHREQHQEEERSQEATENSLSQSFKKSTMVKTVKNVRAPMLPQNGGQVTRWPSNKIKDTHLPNRNKDHRNTDRSTVDHESVKRTKKQTRFVLPSNRRSWSESDLLQEIDKELKLAKGFLFQDVYNVKHEYMSEPETENDRPRKMAQLGRRQYDGIGPMTVDGMPIILRSEVKEPHQHEWYKRLYQTIHKQKHGGRHQGKTNGYLSEPEPSYDSDYSTIKYRPVNTQRLHSVSSALNVRNSNDKIYGTLPNPVKAGLSTYKNQPGRIEDYVTGHSSISEKETKEQLDQAKLSSRYTEGNLSRALAKESGYTSDSNLILHKKELPPNSPLSPVEQKQAYKHVQAGGEPPLFGFRKPAPEKSRDNDLPCPKVPPPPNSELTDQVSPNRYYESDVNIHFKTPVRQEFKSPMSEEELALRQAEQMQKLYQEERRRKYLQELQDMNSRRHTDNFTPSQKSPIALNRYDDFPADLAPKPLNQSKSVARALYNFQAQNSKELSFKKGDIIFIRRAIDKNWYEGEHNAMIGLFPANYVEVINKDIMPIQVQHTTRSKPSEGQARAKYNFQAQSGVELSLNKGELVALTRRVDDNWFEGRVANRKGIFPVSYVEVLTDIGAEDIAAKTTTSQQQQQTNVINARPSLDTMRTNINNEFNTLTRNGVQAPNSILRETRTNQKTDFLHVDTSSEPLVYRALYKYRPQNSDELELLEGDIVHVLEKCDDGWYVGTSQRTGCFGTFPGNYVERL